MTPEFPSTVQRADAAAVVRRNVGSALIAALLMGGYAFGWFRVLGLPGLAKPEITGLFSLSNWIFYYTLRIGAVLMALIAAWCWTGRLTALAVDAGVSIAIGSLLVLTGGGMLMDGGLLINAMLIIFFGVMFFRAGHGNWRAYVCLSPGGRPDPHGLDDRPVVPQGHAPAPAASAVTTTDRPGEPAPTAVGESAREPDPPPEGFLAALAKKPPEADDR